MYLFYFFGLVVVVLGVLSLRGGFRFSRYVHDELSNQRAEFTPFASIIAPCKGLDMGLRENLSALLVQEYPTYEIVFVTEAARDPAMRVIAELTGRADGGPQIKTVVAGAAADMGQKVHNLRVATNAVATNSEVVVFVDSDARPDREWLRSLIAPLVDSNIGATTGYRWFIPVSGFASHLRSVWNASIASALGAEVRKNFCWGGSTAIRRARFEALQVRDRWQGTVSDDFALTRMIQAAGLPIHFVPRCLVPSIEDCTVRELFEFTNRQLKITRVYAPHLWKPVLFGSLFFVAVFFGGWAVVAANLAAGRVLWLSLSILGLIFILGALKSLIRFRAVTVAMGRETARQRKLLLAHLLLWPLASALYLMNALVSAFSRVIEWRGTSYKLKSPTQTVIIGKKRS